jgi:predicted nucleotidyltransferase
MAQSLAIQPDPSALAAFCRRWQIRELALFGSVLRPDFGPESDVDLLVTFAPEGGPGWLQRQAMEEELERLFSRPVDVVERRLVEESPNYIRRRHILSTARVLYGS